MRGTIHARKTIRGSIGYPTLQGEPGEDGYSPQASVTKSGNTATITITDKSGTTTAQVVDGAKGDPGQDGVSPSATVTQTSNGATITITDETGTTTATVTNGQDGDDGYSPSASVSKSGRVATITVTDKTGTTTAQVSDGQDGTPAIIDATPTEDSPNAVSSGGVYTELTDVKGSLNQKYEKPATGIPASDLASGVIPEVPVTDVQMQGVSIVQDGVANIPSGNISRYGVLRSATEQEVKTTSLSDLALTTYTKHNAVFYGLAKAAGDTSQSSSSNAVGTYTDDAKIKIQKMLGIYEAPWELIRADLVTNATKADIEIAVDSNGQPFELTDIMLMISLPEQETEAKVEDYGRVRCYYSGSNNDILYIGTITVSAGASGKGARVWIEQHDGMIERCFTKFSSEGIDSPIYSNNSFRPGTSSHWQLATQSYNKVKICAVTGKCQYYLFGKRKWS